MDPWRQRGSGEPLPTSAAAYNAMMRAAKEARGHDADRLVEMIRRTAQATIVPVRNTTAELMEQFGALGIDGPTFAPDDNEMEFKRRVHLKGAAPAAAYLGKFAILLEPLAPNAIGKAVVSGVVPCKVWFPDGDVRFRFADLYTEESPPAPLIAQGLGSAQLLWIDSENIGEDGAWCIVRLGNDTRDTDFKVLVTIDGGSAGVAGSSTCSWTYTAKTVDGATLGTTLTPERRRLVNTPYTSTPADTIGRGYYNTAGEFVLANANETVDTQYCPPGGDEG